MNSARDTLKDAQKNYSVLKIYSVPQNPKTPKPLLTIILRILHFNIIISSSIQIYKKFKYFMQTEIEEKGSIPSFIVFNFAFIQLGTLPQASKQVTVPKSLLASIQKNSQDFILSAEDLTDNNHEKIQDLLFSIAVYVESNPQQIKKLAIRHISIPTGINELLIVLHCR